uniref:Uncharacterized protein n=1 Tax=Timema shepardi TaxID=629360 RepID=A0A7R9BA41_TIMSH|nr:unnamed protein product [Timema shepardi]
MASTTTSSSPRARQARLPASHARQRGGLPGPGKPAPALSSSVSTDTWYDTHESPLCTYLSTDTWYDTHESPL